MRIISNLIPYRYTAVKPGDPTKPFISILKEPITKSGGHKDVFISDIYIPR